MSSTPPKINWVYTVFFAVTPVLALAATVFMIKTHQIHWQTMLLTAFYTVATGMSITAGYHRLFSHRAYKANFLVRLFFFVFGSASMQGSAVEWCSDHRIHHLHTDTPTDPYNINQGFWHAHMGWILKIDSSKRDISNVDDLVADPLLNFQHRHFLPLGIFFCFFAPMLIAGLWHDMLGGFVFAGLVRMVINHHSTWFINSIAHMFGTQPYDDRGTARDNPIVALLTWGEGFHNFHHKFPLDYRNGIRYYDFDPSKWLIKSLSWVGFTHDLKSMPDEVVLKYRMIMDQKRFDAQASKHDHHASNKLEHMLEPTKQAVLDAAKKVDELKKAYREVLSKSRLIYLKQLVDDYTMNVTKQYRRNIKEAKADLNKQLESWEATLADPEKPVTAQ
jgi:stearoyl-CoA desaturase (Delta-9 desaturase)